MEVVEFESDQEDEQRPTVVVVGVADLEGESAADSGMTSKQDFGLRLLSEVHWDPE